MILLDTHVILWWRADGARLSKRAQREIDQADAVLVSPISFWEISTLLEKRRIELDRDRFVWMHDFLADERVELAPLTPTAAAAAGQLPADGFEGDPADALICATARECTVPLVTKDRAIRAYAMATQRLKAIW